MVQILDLSTNFSVVASATVTATSLGGFTYTTASGVLNTSDTYTIYSLFNASSSQYGDGPITFDPSIINVPIGGSNTGFGGPGQLPPVSNPFANILAVNFQFTPTAVPEPASLAMLGLGMAGVVIFRRRAARIAA